MKDRYNWYVGYTRGTGIKEAFRCRSTMTPDRYTHTQFSSVLGPFKTKRAAMWAQDVDYPFYSIANAERIAKSVQQRAANGG